MQNTSSTTRTSASPRYRERLSPSLWFLVSAAVVAPMAALTVTPVDGTLALIVGVIVAAAVVVAWALTGPVVLLADGVLRAGRASIAVTELGTAVAKTGDDARRARGPELGRHSWHLVRGGIDGIVEIEITDPEDPARLWVISSRTPDRLVAALRRAQLNAAAPSSQQ
ncbi:DUF3093 domain-containing protein [Microbacterium sediminicola]|uniref:DUF3093 domain-containing protein n=1 Tax=Microbacterium sediminicola TaxID=415210 RepID=A0ABP4TV97_9MICO